MCTGVAINGQWSWRAMAGLLVAVAYDFLDGSRLGDEGKNLHLPTAVRTGQRVDIIDSVDELGPALG